MDALGQVLAPLGWPVWPLMALLVAAVAVAEAARIALGVAALADAAGRGGRRRRRASPPGRRRWPAAFGYVALALAVHHALRGEKRAPGPLRWPSWRASRRGLEQLDTARARRARDGRAAPALRQVSEDGASRPPARPRRRAGRGAWRRLARVARAAIDAHAVLYFDLDRERDVGRAARRRHRGAACATRRSSPLTADPFAFVLDRGQSFYATDFKRLLWSLPYYRGEVRVGSLLAVPVLDGRRGGAAC